MIARILVFATLALVLCGGAWYVLRETPEKQIFKLRAEAERCFFDDFGDMEKARDLNDKVLQLLPDSTYDLVFRARLDERLGTAEGLRNAVEIYDRVLAKGESTSLGVAFLEARACRTLSPSRPRWNWATSPSHLSPEWMRSGDSRRPSRMRRTTSSAPGPARAWAMPT
jgi:hypothetical protein